MRASVVLLLAIGSFACSRSPDPAPSRAATTESATVATRAPAPSALSAPSAPAATSAGEAPRITAVRAHGSGCPNEASTRTTILPDGSAVVDLATYAADLASGGALQVKECTLSIKVAGSPGQTFHLASVTSSGEASVDGEAGVRGEETTKVYVQGDPTQSESRSTEFLPAAGAPSKANGYETTSTFGDAVWSPCGGGRDLVVQSRVVLRNNPGRSGHAHLGPRKMRVVLASKACSS